MNKDNHDSYQQVINALCNKELIAIHDHSKREDEIDLVTAAEYTTAEHINFMATHGRGIVCAAIPPRTQQQFNLELQPRRGQPQHRCNFTVSIDAHTGITTGTSAADRALTANVLANPQASPGDIVTPGHLFPLVGHPNGLAGRQGHTEASIAICQQAGLSGCAIICEIMNPDGTMARPQTITAFLSQHNIPLITITQILENPNYEHT